MLSVDMKEAFFEDSSRVYNRLMDSFSKRIFEKRVMYSITNDPSFVEDIVKEIPQVRWLIHELAEHNVQPRLIYGAGLRGRRVTEGLPSLGWKGIIDQSKDKQGTMLNGIKVFSMDLALQTFGNPVIVVPNKEHGGQIIGNLINKGIPREDIIYFGDQYTDMLQSIYFDLPELTRRKDGIFVDCGAYDGESSIAYSEWNKKFKKIICFEPDELNCLKCEENLSKAIDNNKYRIIKAGTWNKRGSLRFNAHQEEFSSVSEDGKTEIIVTTLDHELMGERVTFIKMDIEGSEKETLEGAETVIRQNKPTLAISVYHKPEDIFEIPAYLLKLVPTYKFYLRHYTLREWDTVLYAVAE